MTNRVVACEDFAQAVIETCGQALLVTDAAGILQWINPAAADLFCRADDCLGEPVAILVAEAYRDALAGVLKETNASHSAEERGTQTLHLNGLRSDGSRFPLEMVFGAFAYDDGQGILVSARQAAEETVPSERALQQQQLRLREEYDTFALGLSHNLTAAVRGINAVSDWLSDDRVDERSKDWQEYRRFLQSRMRRLHSLIRAAQVYTQIGNLENTWTPLDLDHEIQRMIDRLDVPDDVMVTVEDALPRLRFPAGYLQKVFRFLIDNAIQYRDKSPGFIKVCCVERDDHWTFSVADNGPGIAPDQQEEVFHIFQRSASDDGDDRAGVGLALAQRIICHCGGSMWLESKPGEGSTFFFTVVKSKK